MRIKTPRYSSHRIGGAESAIGQISRLVRRNLCSSGIPTNMWPRCVLYVTQSRRIALRQDGWELFPIRLRGPFGCIVYFVKEGPDNVKGRKFSHSSEAGALLGYVLPDMVVVGQYTMNSSGEFRWKIITTQNATVFPREKYVDNLAPEDRPPVEDVGLQVSSDPDPDNMIHDDAPEDDEIGDDGTFVETESAEWVKTSCCGAWRRIPASDSDACGGNVKVRCEDVRAHCSDPPSYIPERDGQDVMYVLVPPDRMLNRRQRRLQARQARKSGVPVSQVVMLTEHNSDGDETDPDEESYAAESISKRDAFSDAEWFDSGRTCREVFEPAVAAEFASFEKHGTFDVEHPILAREVRAKFPRAKLVLLNLILVTKNVEKHYARTPQERKEAKGAGLRAKARLVAYVEVRAGTLERIEIGEVTVDENLFTDNPSGTELRTCTCVWVGAGKHCVDVDFDTAYQTSPTYEPPDAPAYVVLPRQCWPESWKAKFGHISEKASLLDQPVCLILGSVYGRERAGHDFHRFANECFKELGFASAADVAPCLTIYRPALVPRTGTHPNDFHIGDELFKCGLHPKPPALTSTKIPSGAVRYTDDTRIAGDTTDQVAGMYAQLATKFYCGAPDDSNNHKHVGSTHSWAGRIVEEPGSEYHHSIQYDIDVQQHDLVDKYLKTFEAECATYGITLKERATPLPGQVVNPMTRAQEERAAAEAESNFNRAEPGKFAKTAASHVNSIAYVQDHSRPDLSFAVRTVQKDLHNWRTFNDKQLLYVFGYLKRTRHYFLRGTINSHDVNALLCCVVGESDASHAGQRDDRKGVSGYAVFLIGPRTRVLLAWNSKGIPVVTLSSAESELAGAVVCSKVLVWVKMLVDVLLGYVEPDDQTTGAFESGVLMKLFLDAKSTIQMILKAGSSKVRYTRRTTGISIYWLHELFRGLYAEIDHKSGEELCADTFTKPLDILKFDKFRAMLGLTSEDPADLDRLVEYFPFAGRSSTRG